MGLNLKAVVGHLQALEDTIIGELIERAQFKHNPCIYKPAKSGFKEYPDKSLFDIRLLLEEKLDALFGRFTVPEERPFNKELPKPKRVFRRPETGLALEDLNAVNLTPYIIPAYLSLVPNICEEGEDGHHGSSVEHDVGAFRAISERIHYGSLYVAECKFQDNQQEYSKLIIAKDEKGLMNMLTVPEREIQILKRIHHKVAHIQAEVDPSLRRIIQADAIVGFYRGYVIPLTKKGEVIYLLQRLNR